ncbi:transcriptional regulator [Lelliottia nimipressuralis]|uniref:transcriptional regulator n=1 Tax=Lelliottia nimipressuralis TaxID=69220 RepID=UPI0035565533
MNIVNIFFCEYNIGEFMTLAEFLKKSRMRQQDLAIAAGCSQSMISRVLTGKSKFGSLAALSVAKATSYQVTPHELRPDIHPTSTSGLPADSTAVPNKESD